MEPNFHDQQYIIIDKVSYRAREPKRGEVIVFHPPNAPTQNYIKRIIGLPGEKVSVTNDHIFINDRILTELYLDDPTTDPISLTEPLILAPDEYFVLGDNRDHSSDSREWGGLPRKNFEGRTWFIALPFSDFTIVKTPSYQVFSSAIRASRLAYYLVAQLV